MRLAMIRPFWTEMGLPVENHGDAWLADALTLMAGRGRTAREMAEYSDYFVSFEPVKARYASDAVPDGLRRGLKDFFGVLLATPDWTPETLEESARRWVADRGAKMKDYAMTMRFALTGMKVSPGIFEVAVHLGRDEVRRRLEHYALI